MQHYKFIIYNLELKMEEVIKTNKTQGYYSFVLYLKVIL